MTIDIVERLREWKNSYLFNAVDLDPSEMEEAADEIEWLRKELDRYKYATGVLLTAFNSKWQSRTPAEVLRAALEDKQ